jgi:hypothetical protein
LGRRLLNQEQQGLVEAQKLKLIIKEHAMRDKGGDTFNITVKGNGPVVGKVEGDFVYNDPKALVQAIATLRPAFQHDPAANAEVLAKLNEIDKALRAGKQPGALKSMWAWVVDKVDIKDLPEYALEAWELFQRALPR